MWCVINYYHIIYHGNYQYFCIQVYLCLLHCLHVQVSPFSGMLYVSRSFSQEKRPFQLLHARLVFREGLREGDSYIHSGKQTLRMEDHHFQQDISLKKINFPWPGLLTRG